MIRHGIQLLFFIFDSATISYMHITYFGHFYSYYPHSRLTSAPWTASQQISRFQVFCLACLVTHRGSVGFLAWAWVEAAFFSGAWRFDHSRMPKESSSASSGNSLLPVVAQEGVGPQLHEPHPWPWWNIDRRRFLMRLMQLALSCKREAYGTLDLQTSLHH